MNDVKYIGLDVHQATISAAVRDSDGKLVLEAILETKAETMLQFIHGLRGSLHVTFEEGTSADWLYTLLKPHVTEVLVCDPRKNALLRGLVHPDQNVLNATQNSLCRAVNRRRGCCACRASNCDGEPGFQGRGPHGNGKR